MLFACMCVYIYKSSCVSFYASSSFDFRGVFCCVGMCAVCVEESGKFRVFACVCELDVLETNNFVLVDFSNTSNEKK